MKRIRLAFVLFAAFAADFIFAADVSSDMATKAIRAWLTCNRAPMGERIGVAKRIASDDLQARTFSDAEGNPLFHVLELDGGGFVVTSGETGLEPIIAFSEKGAFDAMDENALYVLLRRDMLWRRELLGKGREKRASASGGEEGAMHTVLHQRAVHEESWSRLVAAGEEASDRIKATDYEEASSITDMRVPALMKTAWTQSGTWTDGNGEQQLTFNRYTPNNFVCGCVATAYAQVMKYWEYPKGHIEPFVNYCYCSGTRGDYTAIGGVYDWANMPNANSEVTRVEQCEQLGKLVYDIGVACHMSWAKEGSGASCGGALAGLKSYYGYVNGTFKSVGARNTTIEGTKAADVILGSLDGGMPSVLSISGASSGSGHAVVADGYGYVGGVLFCHVNFGWSDGGAWYNLFIDPMNGFTALSGASANVHPTITGAVISGRVLTEEGRAVVGAEVELKRQGGETKTTTTSEYGVYSFRAGVGEYTLAASYGEALASGEAVVSVEDEYSNKRNNDLTLGAAGRTLASLIISGPESIPCAGGKNVQYEAYGVLDNGTTVKLPASWSLTSGANYAQIGAISGSLAPFETVVVRSVTIKASAAVGGVTRTAAMTVSIAPLPRGTPLFKIEKGTVVDILPNGCTDLRIPNGVRCIGEVAGTGCTGITNLVIPAGVVYIDGRAFMGCRAMRSVSLPDTLKYIYSSAFEECVSLEEVSIPASVTTLNYAVFKGCSNLRKVRLPHDLEAIGSSVFSSCSNLTDITLPAKLGRISSDAFADCVSLAAIEIPVSVSNIYSYAFRGCEKLTRIIIPDAVKNISSGMFCGCSSLGSIVLPQGVTNIGYYAFEKCSSLKKFVVPSSVITIGSHIFSECENLSRVTISGRVVNIPYAAFYGCGNLKSVELPQGVTNIDDSVFSYCTNLTHVVIKDGLKRIGASAFSHCESLESVNLPESVTEIERSAFSTCRKLKAIGLSQGLGSVADYAFFGCVSLESINLPESVTNIGNYAFYRCESIKNVAVPARVENIGGYAFCYCTNMLEVTFLGNAPTTGDGVFASCSKARIVVSKNSSGWDVQIPGTWQGLKIVYEGSPPSIADVDIEGPEKLFPGETAIYVCRQLYSDGALKMGSASWWIWDDDNYIKTETDYASIDGSTGAVSVKDTCLKRTIRLYMTCSVGEEKFYKSKTVAVENCYFIRFHRYDASDGKEESYEFDYGVEMRLPSLKSLGWARRGFDFLGWATSQANAAAGKVWKKDWAVVSTAADRGKTLNVWAVWALKSDSYAIKFIRNDGAGTWRTVGFTHGAKTRIPSLQNGLGWARRGYTFKGWALTTADAAAGKVWKQDWSYVSTAAAKGKTLTVYAVWELKAGFYQIRFNKNDGTTKWRAMGFPYGVSTKLSTVKALGWSVSGKRFKGWATSKANADAGKVWKTDGAAIATAALEGKTISIYAIWQ